MMYGSWEIIILHLSITNDDHIMYGSWDMECNRQNLQGPIFLPFSTTNNSKNQDFEKWKKCLEISSFYTSVPKIMILCHTVPEIWRVTDVICIFHFKLFFALLNILDFITNGNTGHVFFVEGTSPNTRAGFFFFFFFKFFFY